MAGKRAKVVCPNDGEITVPLELLVLDDAESVYRFTCPRCKQGIEKRSDDKIRSLLREWGVLTIEEVVSDEAQELDDDVALARFMTELEA